MAATVTCDGCGVTAPMGFGADGNFHKPQAWFQRSVFEEPEGPGLFKPHGRLLEILVVCSRECIERLDQKRKAEGKPSHAVVLPI